MEGGGVYCNTSLSFYALQRPLLTNMYVNLFLGLIFSHSEIAILENILDKNHSCRNSYCSKIYFYLQCSCELSNKVQIRNNQKYFKLKNI